MPSIFIWKSDKPNISNKNIKIYSGSNWVLEENDYSSKSYSYLEQIVISESDNSVITFHSKDMPQDWVGSELLEVNNLPYELIKSDNFGKLEHIGSWMRFTSNNEIEFNINNLKKEYQSIQNWIHIKNSQVTQKQVNIVQKRGVAPAVVPIISEIMFDPQNIQLNFSQFLNKYSIPDYSIKPLVNNTTYINNKSNMTSKYSSYNTNKNKNNINKVNTNVYKNVNK